MQKYDECPFCKADLTGEPIPEDLREKHYGGSTHYSRLIGIEIRGGYDGVSYLECPDCRIRWDRWTGKKVTRSVKGSQSLKRVARRKADGCCKTLNSYTNPSPQTDLPKGD
jgi:hypothetical protein